jgi:septal ring factor EnvC (AmiA/AmiB activator)
MKLTNLWLIAALAVAPCACAQGTPPHEPAGSAIGTQSRQERHQQMVEMHKQEREAMRADIEKLKSSLAQMKANIYTIREPNELARWRNNAEMWEIVVNHMDHMQKQMESMEPGMMRGPGMGGPPEPPPSEQKPH